MTKADFVKRVQRTLAKHGPALQGGDVLKVLDIVIQTIKDVIAEGDELRINGLGKFYSKEMGPRVVKGGWKKNGQKFEIPAKKKLGFSSFNSTDRYIQRGKILRNEDGLFADVFAD